MRDNDCNGEVDDDVVSQQFCEDKDGDGHGALGRATLTDCKPASGFGACDGDCDDFDPTYHPGATEVCDLRDNDCDGDVDEGVRPLCGVGLCARTARSCDVADCTPGDPFPETCNGYDDDCDGVVDDEAMEPLCAGGGSRCQAGRCVEGASGAAATGGAPGGVGGNGGSVAAEAGAVDSGPTSGGCSLSRVARRGSFPTAWALAVLLLTCRMARRTARKGE